MGRPSRIAINHDDYHAKHVGVTWEGKQFFLTFTFDAEREGHPGNEFVALYIFDSKGKLLEAQIDEFGPRKTVDKEKIRSTYEQRLADLGNVTFTRIEIAPFQVERFGLSFGLIVRKPESDDDSWAAGMQPDNCMAFFEPWDSGDYDT